MNKILSQAIRKAVSDYKPSINPENNEKRPDLFSLNNDTELFQNSKGVVLYKHKQWWNRVRKW